MSGSHRRGIVVVATQVLGLVGAATAGPRDAISGTSLVPPSVTCPEPSSWCSGFTQTAAFVIANPNDSARVVVARVTSGRGWPDFPRVDTLWIAAQAETTLAVAVDLSLAEPPGTASLTLRAFLADSVHLQETCVLSIAINESLTVTAAGGGSVCTGADVTLLASAIPGASYSWIGPDGFTSLERAPTILGVRADQAGRYCVTAWRGGCVSRTACVDLAIRAAPEVRAFANGPLVFGDTLRLSATDLPGADYDWIGPFGFTATEREPTIAVVQPLHAGTYCVQVTNLDCGEAEACVDVAVRPAEVFLDSLVAEERAVRMVWRSPGSAGVEVVLKRRAGLQPTVELARVTFGSDDRVTYVDRTVRPGRQYAYRLCATRGALDYCFEEAEVSTAGVLVPEVPLRIAPNPARGFLGIEIDTPTAPGAVIDLLDVAGRRTRTIPVGAGSGFRRIAMPVGSDLRPGLYLVRLRNGSATILRRALVAP